MRVLALLLIVPVLAGCLQGDTSDPAVVETASTGRITGPEGAIQGALVQVGALSITTDADGRFRLETPAGPCTVRITAAGFIAKEGAVTCPFDIDIALTPAPTPATTQTDTGSATPPPAQEPTTPKATLNGQVLDDLTSAPVQGARWEADRDGARLDGGVTDADGRFQITATHGVVRLRIEAPCRAVATHETDLQSDLDLEVRLGAPDGQVLPAPVATATAGIGSVTVSWSRIEGAARYEVDEAGSLVDVGGARAWTDHSPGTYRARAIDGCGIPGDWSSEVTATPLPGVLPSLAAPRAVSKAVAERSYPVMDVAGNVIGQQDWRIVTGTGNCCENYVSTTRQGWIMDFGGESLFISKDEGLSWQEIVPHSIQVCGEGAVVPGPAGDIYAMNWEFCLGAGDDGVWTLKYSAQDDTWIEGAAPVHAPFFDRPWMSVFPGPHVDSLGQVSGTRSYIFTNFNDALYGQGHAVSGDGVHYLVQPPILDSAIASSQPLPDRLDPDPDADWTQPIVVSYGKQLQAGLGIIDTSLNLCQVLDTETGRACAGHPLPVQSMQRDGAGRLHDVQLGSILRYRWSDDVGRTWDRIDIPLPAGVLDILEWDLKAHHGLDRAVIALHTEVQGGAQDYAIVLRNIRDTPEVDRVLLIGGGGGTAGSGVAETGQRYDFMTTGFLPDGRIVLSFTDGEFHPPAVAIELK